MKIKTTNGIATLSIEDDEIILENFEIKPEARKKGEGTQLLQAVIKWYKHKKTSKPLTLCAYPQDDSIEIDALVNFYKKNGFEITDDYEDSMIGRCVFMQYN